VTNDICRFLRDMCTVPADQKLRTPLDRIYEVYKSWYEENGTTDFLQSKQFGIQMSKQGCKGKFSHGTTYYPVLIRAPSVESTSESQSSNSRSDPLNQQLNSATNVAPGSRTGILT
jgi:phage/plasmid-associated DNA primase